MTEAVRTRVIGPFKSTLTRRVLGRGVRVSDRHRFATLPSPLYGLYRTRYDLSTLTVTVVYAVFVCGAVVTLLCERLVVARIGRRGAMLGAVATMMAAAAVIVAWKALPACSSGA